MGRPTKLTKAVQEEICLCLRAGSHRCFAAAKVGIDENTLSRWYHRGAGEDKGLFREFFLEVNKAEADFAQTGVDAIKSSAQHNPRHFQWLLSRRFPAQFGRQDNIEAENPEDKAAQQLATQQLLVERLERLFPEPVPVPQEAAEPPAAEPPAAVPDAE